MIHNLYRPDLHLFRLPAKAEVRKYFAYLAAWRVSDLKLLDHLSIGASTAV
jgi:hypothetical protein